MYLHSSWDWLKIQPSNGSIFRKPTKPTIWQTWKRRNLPEPIEQYWNTTFMPQNPEYERRVMDDADIDHFMRIHFGKTSVYRAFASIHPRLGAVRADLWRYCVLYLYGGVYVDADSAITKNLRDWPVNRTAILSCESNPWSLHVPNCTRIWATVNRTFPSTLAISNDRCLVQWMLIFPEPGHPVLQEVIELATQLILEWNDTLSPYFSVKDRAVCLTGPAVFSVAVERHAATSQFVLDGVDYEHKALFKMEQSQGLDEENKRYDSYVNNQPLKVNSTEWQPLERAGVDGGWKVKAWADMMVAGMARLGPSVVGEAQLREGAE
jgi:mannosyltransferase OCH1-like enzyme